DAEVDGATFAEVAYAIETRVGERYTPAGLEVRVTCQVLNQVGEPIEEAEARVEVYPDSGFERTETGLIGHIARDYQLVCSSPALGLRDPTPAIWTVQPDAAARVVTWLSAEEIDSGGSVDIECASFDAFGNPTEDEAFGVRVDPPPARVSQRGMTLTFESAGTFAINCSLPGVEDAPAVALDVVSGLPANLSMVLFPDRPSYRVGNVVELVPQATDRFGNPVPEAPIVFTSDPPLPGFGAGRFRCAAEGRYDLQARVDGPTEDDRELSVTRRILVDFGGPGISCDRPEDGDFIQRPEGGRHALEGTVADIEGVASVIVDERAADLRNDGHWRAEVDVDWGLNVHDVVASDGDDETSTFCAYYAADAFVPEDRPMLDALQLRLGQGALDDGRPDAPLGSLADALRRMVNSQGLVDTVDQAARAQNPIVPNECRTRVLGACLFRLGVEYTGLAIGGPNDISLTLVDGGLRARAVIRELNVSAQLHGTLGNRIRLRAEHITIDLTFDVGLRFDGQPDIRLRGLNEVSVGDLDADFSGILGFLFELVFEAFEGLVRRTIVDALRGFLEDNIDQVLTDLLGNVDIGALSQGFDVPSLTGRDPIRMSLAVGLSTLDFNAARALVGVSTRVDAPIVIADRAPGIPLLPGFDAVALPADRTIGAAVQLGVLNQVMHRLWRAGYFEAEAGGLVANVAGDLPEGVEVFLRIPRPPLVVGVDGEATVRVMLGPLSAGVVYPGFFVEPVRVRIAAEVSATVRLQGERDLVFDGVEIEHFYLALGGADMPARAREVLEDTLRRVVQSMVDRALNDGLPVIPLPEFVVPDDLGRFDLPAGAGLGLRQPRLNGTTAAWILDGNFGE
ncbi:MAG: hypothetical protein KC620_19140, partial [Myxococcales bacterium]|nr:hypothetical protein [Myxococcales bacterium]